MTLASDTRLGRRVARSVASCDEITRERVLATLKPSVRDAAIRYLAALDHFEQQREQAS